MTHPVSYNEAEPSVAAVVGSQNAICTAFSADVQLQGHRIEIIQARGSIAALALRRHFAPFKLFVCLPAVITLQLLAHLRCRCC